MHGTLLRKRLTDAQLGKVSGGHCCGRHKHGEQQGQHGRAALSVALHASERGDGRLCFCESHSAHMFALLTVASRLVRVGRVDARGSLFERFTVHLLCSFFAFRLARMVAHR
jgi:hypothetical protein